MRPCGSVQSFGIPGFVILVTLAAASAHGQTPFSPSVSLPAARKWLRRDVAQPTARRDAGLAYDPIRGQIVLHGGHTGSAYLQDTLTWDGFEWTTRSPSSSPGAVAEQSMVFDSIRERVVLFGGQDSGGTKNGTWEWDGTNWEQKSTSTAPSPRNFSPMAFDSRRGRTILFGGFGGTFQGDTWSYDGTAWTQLNPASSPGARSGASMTYDAARDRCVLFGGADAGGFSQETWEFDGSTWELKLPATSPPTRSRMGFAYSSKFGGALLFGGVNSSFHSDTWSWNGTSWQQLTPATSPSGRAGCPIGYDLVRERFVLFGGAGSVYSDDTWEFDRTTWVPSAASMSTIPSARNGPYAAYDSARNVTVLFGGNTGNTQTWEYDGASWIQRSPATSPSGRAYGYSTFDAGRGKMILFGGFSGSNVGGTFEYDGTNWTQLSVTSEPSARRQGGMAYDSNRSRVVIAGGFIGSRTSETKTLSGTVWTARSAAPGVRSECRIAHDSDRGMTMLFGGNLSSKQSNTWEYDGTSWSTRSPGSVPPARDSNQIAYDTLRKRILLFGGSGSSARLNDSWEWNGTNWTQLSLSTAPPGVGQAAFVYDTNRKRAVLFGGQTDASGDVSTTWELPSATPPTLSSATWQPSSTSALTFRPIALQMSASSPISSITPTYRWLQTAGPSVTISNATSSSASFTPTVSGTYAFSAIASDGAIGYTFATTAFPVAPGTPLVPELEITSVEITPTAVSRGQQDVLVKLNVSNTGNEAVDITTASPVFLGSATSDFTFSPKAGNVTAIAAGATATLEFLVDVGASAGLGNVTIDAAVSGSGQLSGTTTSDSSAAATDGWTVQTPASLGAGTVTAIPTSVLRGDTIRGVTLSVTNSGQAAANITTVSLSFNGSSAGYTVARTDANSTIAGGSTAIFGFDVTVNSNAPLGATQLSGGVAGTDANSGAATSDGNAGTKDNWTVISPAALSVRQVSAPAEVVRGQDDVEIAVTVANTGQSAANITSASLTFDGSGSGYTVSADFPSTIAAGITGTVTFTVDVGEGANLGSVAIDAAVQATSAGDGSAANDSGADTPDSWTVLVPGSIAIRTVSAAATHVTQGQTGLAVTALIENPGQTSVTVASPSLDFDGAATGYTFNSFAPTVVAGGTTATFQFSVDVGLGAPLGDTILDLQAQGAESFTSATVSDADADTTDSWFVRSPARLVIDSVTAPLAEVTRGQANAGVSASIRNSGETTADVSSVALTFNGAATGFTASPTGQHASAIRPGESQTYAYSISVAANAPLGPTSLDATASAADSVTGAAAGDSAATSPDAWTVLTPAQLQVESVTSTAAIVSRGQKDVPVEGSIRNTGGTTAAVRDLSLTFNGFPTGYTIKPSASNPATVPGGSSRSFTFAVDVGPSAATGVANFNLGVTARDVNTSADASDIVAAVRDSWLVQTPSALTMTRFEVPAAVSRGSTVEATVTLKNTGQATARLDPVGLAWDHPALTVAALPGHATSLAGGASALLRYSVTVALTAKPTTATASITATGADVNTSSAISLTVAAAGTLLPLNHRPTAAIAPVASLTVGQTASLDASGSFDGPDARRSEGDPLAFAWSFASKPALSQLASIPGTASAQFVPDRKGTYGVRLVVDDGHDSSDPVTAAVEVLNSTPVARAADVAIEGGQTARLDGSASSDADLEDTLAYSWRLVSKPASSFLSDADIRFASGPSPELTPDVRGAFVLELTVSDGLAAATTQAAVIADNEPPVARASGPATATATRDVEIDGSASSDPEDRSLTFRWSFASRPALTRVTDSDLGSGSLTQFRPDRPGTYTIELVVDDGFALSPAATVSVLVLNDVPIASLAGPASVAFGEPVSLDARGSRDPEAGPITYSWRYVAKPDASTLRDAGLGSASTSGFTPDAKGTFVIGLAVADGVFSSSEQILTISVRNSPPVASASPLAAEQPAGARFLLDGRASSDPNPGDELTYQWTVLAAPAGSTAAPRPDTAALTEFVPDLPGDYTVQLRVADGDGASASVQVSLRAVNGAPFARVATPLTGSLTAPVVLDGSTSGDAETPGDLRYHWRLVSKPASSLLTAGAIVPSGTAAASRARFQPDRRGTYVFELVTRDSFTTSAPATGVVVVPNSRPIASAPPLVSTTVGVPVAIDGSASADADPEDRLSLRWRLTVAPKASRLPADSPEPAGPSRVRFTPDAPGFYVIRLVASDGALDSPPFPVSVLAVGQSAIPTAALLLPPRLSNARSNVLTVLGAGFGELQQVLLSRPPQAAATPLQIVTSGDAFLKVRVPAGLAPGSYALDIVAHGVSSGPGGPRLTIQSPPELRVSPGENPIITFGAEEDRDESRNGSQSAVQLSLPDAPLGMRLRFTLLEIGQNGATKSKDSFELVVRGSVLTLPALDLLAGRTYILEVRDPDGNLVARAVLSRDGPPVAIAESDAAEGAGPQIVTLRATSSRTPAPPLAYRWRLFDAPLGASSLDSTLAVTTYRAERAGTYRFELAVSDTRGKESTAALSFEVANVAPQAIVPAELELILPDPRGRIPAGRTTTTLQLDARGSRDTNGDPLRYEWEVVSAPGGSAFSLAPTGSVATLNLTTAQDSEGALLDAGVYVVRLTVADPRGASSTAFVRVLAVDPGTLIPDADAGLDRAVAATLLSSSPAVLQNDLPDPLSPDPVAFVRLDGRESVDPNVPPRPLAFAWSVLAVPPGSQVATLAASSSAFPRFVPDRPGKYRFGLVVSNGRFESSLDEVEVLVTFREGNRPPRVQAVVRDPARRLSSETQARPLRFLAGRDRVQLDGSLSSDPDPGDRLRYQWLQTAGPPVALAPSAAAPVPSFVPIAPGLYAFRLRVVDGSGVPDTSAEIPFFVQDPADTPPTLSVFSMRPASSARGEDFEPFDTLATPRSLRVRVGDEVALIATAVDPDAGRPPLEQKLAFSFRQIAGPTVLLLREPPGALSAVARFVPTTSRVHVFEVVANQLDASGVDTGTFASRHIRIVVDSDTNGVPEAAALPFALKDELSTCMEVRLFGNRSADAGPNPTSSLLFRWVQVGGPAVTLSNPFSSIVTFVAPDFADDAPRQYRFQLFVDDGADRSEPSPVGLVVAPGSQRSASLPLGRGFNLVTLPLDPSTATPFRVADLLQRAGASQLVRLSPSGFRAEGGPLGGGGEAVRGNEAFLLMRPGGSSRRIEVGGRRWGAASARQRLFRGLNALGYPRGTPAGETAEQLLQRTGARYVVDTTEGAFRVYIPGLTPPFPIEEGKAYLLSIPQDVDVVLPGCE